MRLLPWVATKRLLLFILLASCFGIGLDRSVGNKIDYWVHDIATVYQARTQWKYSAIVVLDDAVPMQVSRKQALPLFARATEQLVAAGAKGVFLDAELPKENEGIMPYAVCIESNGQVRWSRPRCIVSTAEQCQVFPSAAGDAPFKMQGEVFNRFHLAPYLPGQADLPDFLLFGTEAEANIPVTGMVALDRVVNQGATIDRWLDLSEEHAVAILGRHIAGDALQALLYEEVREECNNQLPCRRIRLSHPRHGLNIAPEQPILPVSQLASCDTAVAQHMAALAKDRVVILQMTTPTEPTDVAITPMTTALWGPHLLTPGPQFLVDSIETLLNNDYPQEPPLWLNYLLFIIMAACGVCASAFLRQFWLWLIGLCFFLALSAACFFLPTVQLWPVTVCLLTFAVGALQSVAMHLLTGFKEGKLIVQYMPSQVHSLLLTLGENETFRNQRYQAIVLMSDLAGYTRVTSMLKEPMLVLDLMNDYLNETSFVLQDQYDGWLETYIGDMVCYYWPYKEQNQTRAHQNALRGAVALSQLQKRFFATVLERYHGKFPAETLENISKVINAGIGLTSGTVVMGDLGPKKGVRKFGILGDPMNLTSRVEAMTRHFNTEIITTAPFVPVAQELGFPLRRLGNYCVKGRDRQAEMLYAVGAADDPRFQPAVVQAWEQWLSALEHEQTPSSACPECFHLDQSVLTGWNNRGLLRGGIWYLDEK